MGLSVAKNCLRPESATLNFDCFGYNVYLHIFTEWKTYEVSMITVIIEKVRLARQIASASAI